MQNIGPFLSAQISTMTPILSQTIDGVWIGSGFARNLIQENDMFKGVHRVALALFQWVAIETSLSHVQTTFDLKPLVPRPLICFI